MLQFGWLTFVTMIEINSRRFIEFWSYRKINWSYSSLLKFSIDVRNYKVYNKISRCFCRCQELIKNYKKKNILLLQKKNLNEIFQTWHSIKTWNQIKNKCPRSKVSWLKTCKTCLYPTKQIIQFYFSWSINFLILRCVNKIFMST